MHETETLGQSVQGRLILAFYFFVGFSILAPMIVRMAIHSPESNAGVWLSWVVVLIAGLRLFLLSLQGEMRLLSLTFYVFVYVWLGIAPLVQYSVGVFPHGGQYTTSETLAAFNVVLIGIAAYEVGKRIPFAWGGRIRRWNVIGQRLVSGPRVVGLGIIAIVVSAVIISYLGGVSTFIAPRNDLLESIRTVSRSLGSERLQLMTTALRVPPFVALYLIWWLWLRGPRVAGSVNRLALLSVLAALLAINALISNPVNSARYWVGTIGMSLIFITIRWNRRWSFLTWSTVLITAFVVLFPYADLFRSDLYVSDFHFRGMAPLAEKSDYDAFQQLLNATAYVSNTGIQFGRQVAGAFLFWVPRVIWAGKPTASGVLVAEHVGYTNTNLAMPLWGEAYLDGGVLLVCLAFLVYGRVSESIEQALISGGIGQGTLFAVLVPVVAGYQIFLLRGSFMVAVAYLTPIVVLLTLATKRGPRAGGRESRIRTGEWERSPEPRADASRV